MELTEAERARLVGDPELDACFLLGIPVEVYLAPGGEFAYVYARSASEVQVCTVAHSPMEPGDELLEAGYFDLSGEYEEELEEYYELALAYGLAHPEAFELGEVLEAREQVETRRIQVADAMERLRVAELRLLVLETPLGPQRSLLASLAPNFAGSKDELARATAAALAEGAS